MYLNLREKETIEEGIQWREQNDDGSEVVCYCPGDGTRYVVIVSPIRFPDETLKQMGLSREWENVLITLASDPGNARSLLTHRGAFIAYDWLKPKLDVTLASAITLSEFVGWLIGGKAWSCDEAREHFAEESTA